MLYTHHQVQYADEKIYLSTTDFLVANASRREKQRAEPLSFGATALLLCVPVGPERDRDTNHSNPSLSARHEPIQYYCCTDIWITAKVKTSHILAQNTF